MIIMAPDFYVPLPCLVANAEFGEKQGEKKGKKKEKRKKKKERERGGPGIVRPMYNAQD